MKTRIIVIFALVVVAVLPPLQVWGVNFALPFTAAMYFFGLIVGGYTGMDQFSSYMTTKKLPSGVKYTGSRKKLFIIAVVVFAIMAEYVFFQALLESIELPLSELFVFAGIIGGLVTAGNKAVNAVEKEGN